MLLYNSRLQLFLGKLKSRWSGPFRVSGVLGNRAIEVENKIGERFKVNGKWLKMYIGEPPNLRMFEVVCLHEALKYFVHVMPQC